MKWIYNIVTGLLDTYKTNNPYELCKYLNIIIHRINYLNPLLCGKNSMYYRNLYNQEIIFIRDDLSIYEEIFILRHELGHAVIHTQIINSNFANIGKLEKQANYFALLLSEIKFDVIEMNGMSLEQIASCANVTYESLAQLVNL